MTQCDAASGRLVRQSPRESRLRQTGSSSALICSVCETAATWLPRRCENASRLSKTIVIKSAENSGGLLIICFDGSRRCIEFCEDSSRLLLSLIIELLRQSVAAGNQDSERRRYLPMLSPRTSARRSDSEVITRFHDGIAVRTSRTIPGLRLRPLSPHPSFRRRHLFAVDGQPADRPHPLPQRRSPR